MVPSMGIIIKRAIEIIATGFSKRAGPKMKKNKHPPAPSKASKPLPKVTTISTIISIMLMKI